MARRVLLVVSVVAVVAVGVLGVSGAGGVAGSVQARWVVTDLGTLGGQESAAAAINERGQVVGWSGTKARYKSGAQISHAFLWQNGKMIDLGTLGGFAGASGATDINARGQIVGVSDARAKDLTGDPGSHAFLWQNGKLGDLTPKPKIDRMVCYSYDAGLCRVYGAAINERGTVVVLMTSHGNLHDDGVFLWQNGKLIDLGSLGRDPIDEVYIGAINDHNEVVGDSETGAQNEDDESINHAFLWQNGRMVTLGSFAGSSGASDINESGQVAVSGETKATDEHGDRIWHAFLWQNKKMTYLGTLGGNGSGAAAINDHGQIVGWSDTTALNKKGDQISHAFLWQNGVMTDLGSLGVNSQATLINERGQVVGMFETGATDKYGTAISRPFVWQNGTITALSTLGGLTEALAINDHNQIVGYSTTKTGQQHAVLWTLKPG